MRALSCRSRAVRVALAGIVGVTALALCPRAQAGVAVVSDDFNYSTYSGIYEGLLGNGGPGTPYRTPRLADLPGGLWQTPGGNPDDTMLVGADHQSVFPSEALHLQHGTGAAVRVGSKGTYTKPAQLQIAVDVGGLVSDAVAGHGDSKAYLGFFSVAYQSRDSNPVNPFGPVTTHFTGLSLSLDGSVTLYQDGTAGASVAYTGTFDPAAVTHLSYEVNTATGAISNISVQGSSSAYSFGTGAFTDGATAYAGVGMDGSGSFADNFVVMSVPEPAMIGLGGVSGGLFMVRRRAKA